MPNPSQKKTQRSISWSDFFLCRAVVDSIMPKSNEFNKILYVYFMHACTTISICGQTVNRYVDVGNE